MNEQASPPKGGRANTEGGCGGISPRPPLPPQPPSFSEKKSATGGKNLYSKEQVYELYFLNLAPLIH
jgi:hypothetical protein